MLIRLSPEREKRKERLNELLSSVATNGIGKYFCEVDVRLSNDVHGFYRLQLDISQMIHVQAYPRLSSDEIAIISANLKDYDLMMKLRTNGSPIGGEHASTKLLIPNMQLIRVSYDQKDIQNLLLENVPHVSPSPLSRPVYR